MKKRVSGLLLAAGQSSRLGRPKQLLPWNGTTLLRHIAETLLTGGLDDLTVVLGAYGEESAAALDEMPLRLVTNPDWSKGMGHTLKFGLKAVVSAQASDAVLVSVCDQPFLTAGHIRRMLDRYHETEVPVIASGYAHAAGVPALFDRSLFPRLHSLDDARGAKELLRALQPDVIPFALGEVDIDTEEDLSAALGKRGAD